ncbi:MAG: hypothetical protein HN337_09365 [Deltaproteobacteria bacterium]|nr:hypothetical protein [Deltaproteobacteria bacterium]
MQLLPAFASAASYGSFPPARPPSTEFIVNPIRPGTPLQLSASRIHPFGPPPSQIGRSSPTPAEEVKNPRRRIVTHRPPETPTDSLQAEASPKKARRRRSDTPTFSTLNDVSTFMSQYANHHVRMEDIKTAAKRYLDGLARLEFDPTKHTIMFRNFYELDGIISGRLEVYDRRPKKREHKPFFTKRVFVATFFDYRKMYEKLKDSPWFSRPEFVGSKPDVNFRPKTPSP